MSAVARTASGKALKRRSISSRALEEAVGEALAAEAELVDRDMLADRGDDVLEHALVGAVVEDVAGGEGAHAITAGERIQRMEPFRLARAAAVGEGEMGAGPENVGHLGKRGLGDPVGLVRHQSRDQAVRLGGDILPMEEALALLALPAVGPAVADGEQAGEPRPGGAVLGPDQKAPSRPSNRAGSRRRGARRSRRRPAAP